MITNGHRDWVISRLNAELGPKKAFGARIPFGLKERFLYKDPVADQDSEEEEDSDALDLDAIPVAKKVIGHTGRNGSGHFDIQ